MSFVSSPPPPATFAFDRSTAPLESPEGTRDWLADDARLLRVCEKIIGEAFDSSDFAEVIPPSLERSELFSDVAALRTSDASGASLALRADFTSQVARIAAGRFKGQSPLKLWYRGPILRDAPLGRITPRERFQSGLELIGDPSIEADVEVISLAAKALFALGFVPEQIRISLGSTAYFGALLQAAGVENGLAGSLRDAIDRKNRSEAERLLHSVENDAVREALLFLASSVSPAKVLETAKRLSVDQASLAAVERLEAVVNKVRDLGLSELLEVDLGEVRGLGYYTGLVFNVYLAGAPGAVGGGGRYDSLLSRFGDSRAAVGFSLDLDALIPLASEDLLKGRGTGGSSLTEKASPAESAGAGAAGNIESGAEAVVYSEPLLFSETSAKAAVKAETSAETSFVHTSKVESAEGSDGAPKNGDYRMISASEENS